jgi:drug/metabolite transporter (DMT)-like permease
MLSGEAGWPGLGAGLLVGLACVFWGIDNHLTALIDGMTPSRSTLWKGAVAGTTNLAIGTAIAPLGPTLAGVCAALMVGALSYGASIALYIGAAQKLGATRSQGFFASAPFVGAGLSFILLGEPVTAWQLFAGLVCVVSVVLLVSGQHQHAHAHRSVEHVHSHRHDDAHHDHEHADLALALHSHWHRHERRDHAHPHWPDLHHRHVH